MKIKCKLYFVLIGVLLTACSSSRFESKVSQENADRYINIENSNFSEKNYSPREAPTAKEDEVFYGDWIFKDVIASGSVSQNSDEDIKKIEGKRVFFSSDSVSFENKKINSPFYKKMNVSKNDFFNESYVDLNDLGIKKDYVTKVEVYLDSNYQNFWDSLGGEFYIKDNNTIIIDYGGDYFRLVRKISIK